MTIHVTHPEPTTHQPLLTDVLRSEHEQIARALACLARLAAHLRADGDVHPDAVSALLGFLREYADHRHHHKEEGVLFPWMERRGLPHDVGPIATMNLEHEESRDDLRHLFASSVHLQTEDGARREFVERAEAYCTLLYAHIDKENSVLYPMADAMGSAPRGTAELYSEPSAADREAEAHWEAVVLHLEREARSWPAPRVVPRAGCCRACG